MAMTPTREQLQSIARAVAAHASAVTKAGLPHDSEHGIGEYAAILAACLAAPPQAPPEPQAMPPIEPGDWVKLEQWPNCEWVVLSVDSDGRVSLIGLDLRYRIRDVIGISKANGTVWTREPRR